MGGPLIVGLGGTGRAGSSTEKALAESLRAVRHRGAVTALLGGEFLSGLPIFNPSGASPSQAQLDFVETIRRADGLIIATPGYHGAVSGIVKNALDTLELLRDDPRPYLTDRAVGVVVTAQGWQAAGTVLTSVRLVIHALRGWPTPLGAALNTGPESFDPEGRALDAKDAWQLDAVGQQVLQFASMMRAGARAEA